MRMVNFTHSRMKTWLKITKGMALLLIFSMSITGLNAQDCPVALSCLGRINVSLGPDCTAEIYPDRIHSAPDAAVCNQSNFEGILDPSLWTFELNGSDGTDGSVDVTNAPASISLTGSGDGTSNTFTNSDLCIDIPCTGTFTFDWASTIPTGQQLNDEPAYVLNGVETFLVADGTGVVNDNGTVSIPVSRGDRFCFRVRSNNLGGETTMTVSNLSLSSGCDYTIRILDMDGVDVTPTTTGTNGFPVIDASFLIDSFMVELSVDDVVAPCWGWMIVEDKLTPTLAQIPDLTVDCDTDDSALFSAPDPFTLIADVSTDILTTDQNMMTFAFDIPNPFPSPVGIITSATLNYTADLPANIQMINLQDANGVDISTCATPITASPVDLTACLSGMSVGAFEMPWQVRFSHLGVNPADTVIVSAVSLSVTMESYFDTHVNSSLDNCGSPTFVTLEDLFIDNACTETPYAGVCSAVRRISYTSFDGSGNPSDTLEFEVCYRARNILEFSLEPSVVLDCDDPLSTIPGLQLGGNDFDPDVFVNCMFNVGVDEVDFGGCGPERIIDRTYTIIDWCSAEYISLSQSIVIIDEVGPTISCPPFSTVAPMMLRTDDGCSLNFVVTPYPVGTDSTSLTLLTDNCSDNFTIDVEFQKTSDLDPNDPSINFQSATNNGNGTWSIDDLEIGLNWIRYIATDECGNSSSCFYEVNVVDGVPPRAVCDQFTVVTLQDNGWARVLPISLDDGSYDECGSELTFSARRVSSSHPCSSDPDFELPDDRDSQGFGGYLQFCCADAGQDIPVILKVTDSGGNYSTCEVIVRVQDKTELIITSVQENVYIDCDEYDEGTLYGSPNQPVVSNSCGTYSVDYEDTPNLDDCGIGTITRRWFYYFGDQRIYVDQVQVIHVSALNYTVGLPGDREADCSNFDTDLNQEPTINGTPISNYSGCANFSWTYEDQLFENVEGYCLKIIRTWIVIDHCIYNPNSGTGSAGYFSGTQVIKVANSSPAILTGCPEDDWFQPDPGTCETTITLEGPDAVDACLGEPIPDAYYSYEVRLDSDNSLVTSGTGRGDQLSLTLEAYVVTWFIRDLCGNVNQACSYLVDVIDEKAPTPYCFGGITTVVMDSMFSNGTPMIEVWASDFDINSFDDCDDDLTFAFSANVNDTNRIFTCDSLGVRNVRIYVFDDAGNYDYCETTINIQANGDVCGGGTSPRIAGKVETEDSRDVEDVEISLMHMEDANMSYQMTNDEGLYAFDDALWSGDYNITANKTDNPLNGVSTLDLVLIQRHILGLEQLDSPYKLVAADINNSEKVTSIDLIELRKLILGIYDDFPNNESWRFINQDYEFESIANPWPFAEEIEIEAIASDEMVNNFVAVKTGDVNGSVAVSFTDQSTESRNAQSLNLNVEAQSFEAGALARIDFRSSDFENVIGMQFSLSADAKMLKFKGVQAGALSIGTENLGLNSAANGIVTMSWNNEEALSFDQDEILFTVYYDALEDASSDQIKIGSEITKAEAYNLNYELMDLNIELRDLVEDHKDFVLYQNTPNPFDQTTDIQFYLPETSKITFEVFDVTGKQIYKMISAHNAGLNVIRFDIDEEINGVLYYKVSTDKYTATKKMLLIK